LNSNKNVIFCAAGVLKKEQFCLIAKRPEGKPFAGLWEFPGGKIHFPETPEEALERELSEELGINIEGHKLQKITEISYEYPDFHLSMPTFLCQHWENEPQGLEGQLLRWVTIQELVNYDILPASKEIIHLLHRFFQH